MCACVSHCNIHVWVCHDVQIDNHLHQVTNHALDALPELELSVCVELRGWKGGWVASTLIGTAPMSSHIL